jgi:hypothetical protein
LVHSGGCSSEYLATAAFVEQVDNLVDSFSGGTHVDQGTILHCQLSNNSLHTEHWKEASIGINNWIFLKDGKPGFLYPPPSQTGWLIDISATQHVWRTVKEAGLKYLHT